MSKRTFYLEPSAWCEPYVLKGAEAHHAIKVLRMRVNDTLNLIDGCGREGEFKIIKATKQELELEQISTLEHKAKKCKSILALAWTKAARRGFILEKAVEFEATEIWFWQGDRSQFPMPNDLVNSWQGQLIAGAKQCQNPFLPVLKCFNNLEEVVNNANDFEHQYALLEADYPSPNLKPEDLALDGTTVYLIGPEGGFSQAEVELLKTTKFKNYSLGKRILRYETAAMMALGLHWWKSELA